MISNFNKGYLNPVIVAEPPPPFPVGSKFVVCLWCIPVLHDIVGVLGDKRKKYRVKHLTSIFQEGTEQQQSLPKKLQSDISAFSKKNLQKVITKVKNPLPSQKGKWTLEARLSKHSIIQIDKRASAKHGTEIIIVY